MAPEQPYIASIILIDCGTNWRVQINKRKDLMGKVVRIPTRTKQRGHPTTDCGFEPCRHMVSKIVFLAF